VLLLQFPPVRLIYLRLLLLRQNYVHQEILSQPQRSSQIQ
jgi:hypothetical protein